MFDCKFIPQKNFKVTPIPFLFNSPMIAEENKYFKLISTISWKGLNRDDGHYTFDHFNIKKSLRINDDGLRNHKQETNKTYTVNEKSPYNHKDSISIKRKILNFLKKLLVYIIVF